jgi:hypothetical protein
MNSFVGKIVVGVLLGAVGLYGVFYMVSCKKVHDVVVQNIQDNVQGDRHYCTDDKEDCEFNSDFFRDTWYAGVIDRDPKTHYNVDSDPVLLVKN